MTSPLQIVRLQGGRVPVFAARWNGKAVTLRLDTSACHKLEGTGDFQDLAAILTAQQGRISAAARRLLEMRQTEAQDDAVVVITALDLD
jgi:hypothetical protein